MSRRALVLLLATGALAAAILTILPDELSPPTGRDKPREPRAVEEIESEKRIAEPRERPAATRLEGRVTFLRDGAPGAGAEVILRDREWEEIAHVVASGDGSYVMNGLAPGKRILLARGPTHPVADAPVVLREGETTRCDLALPPGVVRITGRVHTRDNRPVAGALVYTGSNPRRRSITDTEGQYSIGGIGAE